MNPSPADDVLAIQRLLARYSIMMDAGEMDGFADLWEPDAAMVTGSAELHGAAAILAKVAGSPAGLHLAGLPDIDLAGDRATGRQNLVFVDRDTRAVRIGRYDDVYVRTDHGWRFARRQITMLT